MQDVIQFGPYIINVKLLILAVSSMFGYNVLKFRLKWMKSVNKVIQEEVFNSLMIIPKVVGPMDYEGMKKMLSGIN